MAAIPVRDRYKASADVAAKYPSDVDANGYFVGHPETDVKQVIGLGRQNSTAYAVGAVAFSPSLPAGLVLKCTTAGTTAATEPDYTGAAVGGTVTDGTVVWQYYDLLSGSGVPLGSILPYSANAQTPPYGFLYCEGQAVSRTMYSDLFDLIGTTYGAGDGSTTFNLPNMLDRYPQGDTTAGTVKNAGLPNITGSFACKWNSSGYYNELATYSGSIYGDSSGTVQNLPTTGYTTVSANRVAKLDASRSSAIYGNSDTVTPETLTCRWIIKAYDAPTPSSAQIDLSQYASDLANKAYRDLQNVTNVAYRRRPRKAFALADLVAAVQTGNYNEYDICPGDYYVGASGYTYIFAGDNPMKGSYVGYPIEADHAGLIVDTHETCKWNDANDTTGGYVSSKLHTYLVNTVLPKVKTDLGGVSHLYAHKKLYSNAITATRYNRFGTNTGATSNWAWSDSQYIAALSEMQVYGGTVWSSSGYDTGEADQQLEVFRRFKHTEIFGNEYPWLRDVASATYACYADDGGGARYTSASNAYYVAGLIAFH